MTSSTASGFAMPPEWVRHERTWMEFPPANITFGNDPDGDLGEYRRVWAAVTNAIARFEPVTLICNIGDRAAAEALVDPSVSIAETRIDESWFRDSGPTFVVDGDGRLGLPVVAELRRRQDRVHIGAAAEESDVAEVQEAREANDDVQSKREQRIDEREEAVPEQVPLGRHQREERRRQGKDEDAHRHRQAVPLAEDGSPDARVALPLPLDARNPLVDADPRAVRSIRRSRKMFRAGAVRRHQAFCSAALPNRPLGRMRIMRISSAKT